MPMPFGFTIRDMLWMTLVVALAAGWSISLRRWQNEVREEMVKRQAAESEAIYWRQEYGRTGD